MSGDRRFVTRKIAKPLDAATAKDLPARETTISG
jgi:hypothetical protein